MGKQKTENLNQHKRLNINFSWRFTTRRKIAIAIVRACRQNPLIADRSSLIVDRQVGRYSHLLPYMWLGLCWWRRSVATIRPMVSLGSHGQANIRFRQIWFVTLLPPAASVRVVHCGEMSRNQQVETSTTWTPTGPPCWHTWPEKELFVRLRQHICWPAVSFPPSSLYLATHSI